VTTNQESAALRPPSSAPAFSQAVDCRAGVVRGRGRLTADTAGLLRATVEALAHDGHTRILLDLTGLQDADAPGTRAIASLQTELAERGGRLTVLPGGTVWPP
jgi:anti-anti-sigma regulatory factor